MAQGGCSTLEPYALRVLGDSMEPEFPEGCVVIVDPGHVPRDGAICGKVRSGVRCDSVAFL